MNKTNQRCVTTLVAVSLLLLLDGVVQAEASPEKTGGQSLSKGLLNAESALNFESGNEGSIHDAQRVKPLGISKLQKDEEGVEQILPISLPEPPHDQIPEHAIPPDGERVLRLLTESINALAEVADALAIIENYAKGAFECRLEREIYTRLRADPLDKELGNTFDALANTSDDIALRLDIARTEINNVLATIRRLHQFKSIHGSTLADHLVAMVSDFSVVENRIYRAYDTALTLRDLLIQGVKEHATVSEDDLSTLANLLFEAIEHTSDVVVTNPIKSSWYLYLRPNLERGFFNIYACGGKWVTILGTSGNDEITPQYYEVTDAPDVINGLEGDDWIRSDYFPWSKIGGDDTICGGPGIDTLSGGRGEDHIYGGPDNDIILGGPGPSNNVLWGGRGDDELRGSSGVDLLRGGPGDDELFGDHWYREDDTWVSTISKDYIYGDEGSDYIRGMGGNDQLYGGPDSDWIYGDEGDDWVLGGENGKSSGPYPTNGSCGGVGWEYLYGDEGNDHVYGEGGNDYIHGGEGNDELRGDYVVSGGDDDCLWGDNGEDVLYGGEGQDMLDGGEGNDILEGGVNADEMYGEGGDDELYGQGGGDVLFGDYGFCSSLEVKTPGSDILVGGPGPDTLYGQEFDDDLKGGGGADNCDGGDGMDTASNCETLSNVP